jgi:ribosomal protein L37AE/L43A
MSMRANTCPCCGGSVLRHVRHGELYWFCLSCRQEVPLLTVNRLANVETRHTGILSPPKVNS